MGHEQKFRQGDAEWLVEDTYAYDTYDTVYHPYNQRGALKHDPPSKNEGLWSYDFYSTGDDEKRDEDRIANSLKDSRAPQIRRSDEFKEGHWLLGIDRQLQPQHPADPRGDEGDSR